MRFEEITLTQALARTASRFPETHALMFQGTEISFRELDDMTATFAAALRSVGVKPGDRVSILLPNLIQTVVAIYGALRVGAVVVMHSPRNDDMTLEYQLNDAGSQTLVCLDVLVPRMMVVRSRTAVKRLISCHIRDYLPFLTKKLFALVKKELHLDTPPGENLFEFTDLMAKNQPSRQTAPATMEDLAFILYTSATTGKSKGVQLSHGNMSKNVQQLHSWFPNFDDGREIVVACLPFFHVFGLTCALNIGICNGYGNVLVPLPEPKSILEAIQSYKATFVPALPNFYTGVVHDPQLKKFNLKSLKGCFSGGAALPHKTIQAFESLTGAQICEGYGLTESSPVTHINPFGGKTKPGTIDLPLPDTDAKIVEVDDPSIEITDPGTPGELCVRGPQVMMGYVNLPQKTEDTLKDGWLLTGDIVTVDESGYFTVVDRKSDLIVSMGKKVYPRNVDEVLFAHPKVLEACAIGVPAKGGLQAVKACVVLRKGEVATAEEIISYCRSRLQAHEVPTIVELMAMLPRNPVGKILRKELKRMHLVRGGSTATTKLV